MSYFESIIFGLIQGLTEFLPVSSSGHLQILKNILNLKEIQISYDITLHLGTILAVFIIFRKQIWGVIKEVFVILFNLNKIKTLYKENYYTRLIVFVIIGTIPAVIIGLLFKDVLENVFSNLLLVSFTLLFTTLLLFLTKFFKETNKGILKQNWLFPVVVGILQAVAILPGVSRSGSTIFAALRLKSDKKEAFEFSFLLSIPAILGAAVLEMFSLYKSDSLHFNSYEIGIYLIGFLIAFIFGFLTLSFLKKLVIQGRFYLFGFYTFLASILAFILYFKL